MSAVFNTPPMQASDSTHGVKRLLKFLEVDARHSHDLIDSGALTQLAKTINDYITNPLESMVGSFKDMHLRLIGFFKDIVDKFLSVQKEHIIKAYHIDSTECLKYYIILKDDSLETRENFFEFLDHYESLGIDHKLPIQFLFLPKQAIETLESAKEVVL